ncbi:MAG: hypothetical protein FDX21_10235 [Chlorobium sp.]|nr:MAG: hypothetical protein FDX21_10235 [Chlorobium sp.]
MMPDKELTKKVTEILFRELGYSDAIRFLSLPKEQKMESVERHRNWQNTLDNDNFYNDIFTPDTKQG